MSIGASQPSLNKSLDYNDDDGLDARRVGNVLAGQVLATPEYEERCIAATARRLQTVPFPNEVATATFPTEGGSTVSRTYAPERFTTLPDEQTLADTVVALEEHGFTVEVVDDLDATREAVLARIREGSTAMTNTSVTLQETGIADAINGGGPYESARNRMMALDFATQLPEMKAIAGQPDYALGSVHAITSEGTLRRRLGLGSQLASYAWGAANVIFVVGAQKLVPSLEAAHERIVEHSLPLEDARAYAAYGQNSRRGQDPRDPSGGSRPHPCRPHPAAGRVLRIRSQRCRREASQRWSRSRRGSITSAARSSGSSPRRVWRLRAPLLAAGVSGDRAH